LDKSGAVLPLLSQFHYHFLLEGNDSSEREKEVIVKNKQTQAILEHSELTQKEPTLQEKSFIATKKIVAISPFSLQ
jgi:P pilus assembly chaperone PapD